MNDFSTFHEKIKIMHRGQGNQVGKLSGDDLIYIIVNGILIETQICAHKYQESETWRAPWRNFERGL